MLRMRPTQLDHFGEVMRAASNFNRLCIPILFYVNLGQHNLIQDHLGYGAPMRDAICSFLVSADAPLPQALAPTLTHSPFPYPQPLYLPTAPSLRTHSQFP